MHSTLAMLVHFSQEGPKESRICQTENLNHFPLFPVKEPQAAHNVGQDAIPLGLSGRAGMAFPSRLSAGSGSTIP